MGLALPDDFVQFRTNSRYRYELDEVSVTGAGAMLLGPRRDGLAARTSRYHAVRHHDINCGSPYAQWRVAVCSVLWPGWRVGRRRGVVGGTDGR